MQQTSCRHLLWLLLLRNFRTGYSMELRLFLIALVVALLATIVRKVLPTKKLIFICLWWVVKLLIQRPFHHLYLFLCVKSVHLSNQPFCITTCSVILPCCVIIKQWALCCSQLYFRLDVGVRRSTGVHGVLPLQTFVLMRRCLRGWLIQGLVWIVWRESLLFVVNIIVLTTSRWLRVYQVLLPLIHLISKG